MSLKVGSVVVLQADPNRQLVVGGFGKTSADVYYFDDRGELRNASVPKDILVEVMARVDRPSGEFKLSGKHFQ